ncbi:MAG: hypothetical protein ACYTEQ_15275, partial [Planctomycetota bacterium]
MSKTLSSSDFKAIMAQIQKWAGRSSALPLGTAYHSAIAAATFGTQAGQRIQCSKPNVAVFPRTPKPPPAGVTLHSTAGVQSITSRAVRIRSQAKQQLYG